MQILVNSLSSAYTITEAYMREVFFGCHLYNIRGIKFDATLRKGGENAPHPENPIWRGQTSNYFGTDTLWNL
jgi:hypothetical protein